MNNVILGSFVIYSTLKQYNTWWIHARPADSEYIALKWLRLYRLMYARSVHYYVYLQSVVLVGRRRSSHCGRSEQGFATELEQPLSVRWTSPVLPR